MNHVRARGRSGWGLSCGIFGNGFTLRAQSSAASAVSGSFNRGRSRVPPGSGAERSFRALCPGTPAVLGEPAAKGTGSEEQRARWEGGRLNLARTYAAPLGRAIVRGRISLLEPLMDLCSLPLAYAVDTLLVFAMVQRGYGIALLAMIFFYLGLAIASGENPGNDLIQLFKLPI